MRDGWGLICVSEGSLAAGRGGWWRNGNGAAVGRLLRWGGGEGTRLGGAGVHPLLVESLADRGAIRCF